MRLWQWQTRQQIYSRHKVIIIVSPEIEERSINLQGYLWSAFIRDAYAWDILQLSVICGTFWQQLSLSEMQSLAASSESPYLINIRPVKLTTSLGMPVDSLCHWSCSISQLMRPFNCRQIIISHALRCCSDERESHVILCNLWKFDAPLSEASCPFRIGAFIWALSMFIWLIISNTVSALSSPHPFQLAVKSPPEILAKWECVKWKCSAADSKSAREGATHICSQVEGWGEDSVGDAREGNNWQAEPHRGATNL